MTDFVQLQSDVVGALLSSSRLSTVNVVSYRKLKLDGVVDWAMIWQAARGGKSGAGVLVEMPTFRVPAPNLPGPSTELTLPVVVIEEPNLNMEVEGGTLLSAEEIAQRVLDELHGLVLEGMGALYADTNAIADAGEEFGPLVAYRVNMRAKVLRAQTGRVADVQVVEDALQVSLSCGTDGAKIYYTMDGSFPGPGNEGATEYAGPFGFSGTVLRAAAFKDGMGMSHVFHALVS